MLKINHAASGGNRFYGINNRVATAKAQTSPNATTALAISQRKNGDALALSARATELMRISALSSIGGKPITSLKAVNNVLTLNSGAYYRLSAGEGRSLIWGGSPEIYGDIAKEIGMANLSDETIGSWNRMSQFTSALVHAEDYTIRTEFSASERREYFSQLGFEAGSWATVQNSNGRSGTFYIASDGTPWSQAQIESARSAWDSHDWRQDGCTSDSVLVVNGKEYKMDGEGRFNIPKGEPVIYGSLSESVVPPKEIGEHNRSKLFSQLSDGDAGRESYVRGLYDSGIGTTKLIDMSKDGTLFNGFSG